MLFWNYSKTELVLVFDDESEKDYAFATVLQHLPPYPKIIFESLPNVTFNQGKHRSYGYVRQMWSNFYGDLQSSMDVVAFVDSDSILLQHATESLLFDELGRPRVRGVSGKNRHQKWWDTDQFIFQQPRIATFMTEGAFPVVIKRSHLTELREFIRNRFNASTFDEAFVKITQIGDGRTYSQFDIFMHYAWYFHRDEYSWHLRPVDQTHIQKIYILTH